LFGHLQVFLLKLRLAQRQIVAPVADIDLNTIQTQVFGERERGGIGAFAERPVAGADLQARLPSVS